tara:strand:+ start:196 stop:513 length:318 start_codon:yes stop_codon:yes gene_type:complete
MEKGGIAEAVKTVTKEVQKPLEPEKYDVVFINDHLTPMEFVIRVLKQIFSKSTEEAKAITTYIHEHGKGIVGSYVFEVAEQKGIETTLLARQEGYPLQIKIQKQK